jgi:hypothetical protein
LQIGHQHLRARVPTVIRLKDYRPTTRPRLYLADPDSGNYEFDFFLGNLKRVSTKDLNFTARAFGTDRCASGGAATTDPAKLLEPSPTGLDSA